MVHSYGDARQIAKGTPHGGRLLKALLLGVAHDTT